VRSWFIAVLILLLTGHAVPRAAASAAADEFAAIDAHALAAPAPVTGSVAALSAYLVKPARSERQMARAIFRWITRYVAYDTSVAGCCSDPEVVLDRRGAVCWGYAVLFKALAEAAGMKAEIVVGNSKKFEAGASEAPSHWANHSWNAVEIDGQWQLLDCCWGAGHCDERGGFERGFTPHYFLTEPDVFVNDHFPSDPRWQLLDPPISKEDYLQRVQVRPPFFSCGLRLVSHQSSRIDAGSRLALVIGAPADTYLRAMLYRDGRQVGERYTLAERSAEGFVIRALFPSEGDYVLRIFARRGDASGGDYEWALDHTVRAQPGGETTGGFPEAYDSFLKRNCQLEWPLSRALAAGEPVEFSLTVPNAKDLVVVTGGAWNHLPAEGSRFSGEVPVSSGDVVVFARFAGESAYEGLLRYTAEKTAGSAVHARRDVIQPDSADASARDSCADAVTRSDPPLTSPDLAVIGHNPFDGLLHPGIFLEDGRAGVLGSTSSLFPQSEGAFHTSHLRWGLIYDWEGSESMGGPADSLRPPGGFDACFIGSRQTRRWLTATGSLIPRTAQALGGGSALLPT
jgi:hypothetical protein